MEKTMTRNDLANIFKVTYRTINNWERSGVLPPPDYSIGHTERWKESTVETALAQRGSQPSTAA